MQSQGEVDGKVIKNTKHSLHIILQIMNKDTEDVEGELCDGVEQVLYSIVL